MINEKRLIELISQNINDCEIVTMESKLEEIGFDSYKFIKLVIAIEEEFNVEFEDDDLSYKKYDKVKNLFEHLCS